MTFTLAMVKNPRIWKRAQAEIDAIVGTDRLPEFDDRSSLPYVDAILRETWRWQPPTPLGATTNPKFQTTLLMVLKVLPMPLQVVISTTVSTFPKVSLRDVFTRHARNNICSVGATVFGNIWYGVGILLIVDINIFVRAMARDETRYPDAETFIPERFLDAEGMLTDDKVDFTFGFGRRVCPGKQLRATH